MTERSRRVVLLIDYDNLQICAARDTPGRDLQLTPVVQLAQRYGTVILARAYAEWNLSTERLAVYKAGIEPAFAPVLRTESDRSGKSLADTVMVAEGMDMLWTLSPEVVVLATSDKDLIPLVRVAKQRGAFVVVLGSDFTAIPLREMADEHITYRQLITEAGGRVATEAGPGRQPAALPEPSRRRRDRNGRERSTAVSTPAPTSTPAPSRAEREPAQPAVSVVEPVAPVTTAAPGEADSQTSSRRRRRRGSRRRSDRLGTTSDGANESGAPEAPETESEYEASEAEADYEVSAAGVSDEFGLTTTAADIARASDATVEASTADEPGEVGGVGEAPTSEEVTPAPRERRRRTRRRAATDSGIEAPAEVPVEPEAVVSTPLDQTALSASASIPDQPVEILPASSPEAASTNGPTSVEPSTVEDETAPKKPATRPRRVASATRGRSRRP